MNFFDSFSDYNEIFEEIGELTPELNSPFFGLLLELPMDFHRNNR